MFQVFKTEMTTIELNNKSIPVQLVYAWDYDDCQPDFDYGNLGQLLNLTVKVTANALGESGTDILGGVFVHSNNMETELTDVIKDHEMPFTAILELKANVLSQYKALKDALG